MPIKIDALYQKGLDRRVIAFLVPATIKFIGAQTPTPALTLLNDPASAIPRQ